MPGSVSIFIKLLARQQILLYSYMMHVVPFLFYIASYIRLSSYVAIG